jgi:RecA-family ATPase
MDSGFNFESAFKEAKEQAPARLPDPVEYNDFEKSPIVKPKAIVQNLLDSSSRMVFGGGSKTFKTWAMSDLAISIACGLPWWVFNCSIFPILYVNFELKPFYARERFKAIRIAKGINKIPGNMWIWNLRDINVSNNLNAFRDQAVEAILKYSIAVIFLDPFYKLLGERDERISAELIPILNIFEEISQKTDTSTVTSAHYTKGNVAAKDPLDRISGGAAINRHPDSLLMLTRHETEGSFTIDVITRDFPPLDQFVVTWEYPLLRSDATLDPKKIKAPKQGRPKEYDSNDILSVLKEHDDECSTTELFKVVHEEIGMGERCFYELLKELKNSKQIFKSKLTTKWNCRI